ncbi:DUF4964 domain-containing protein, partial [Sunxiuqinia sp. A32]|uniref:DUF4964 domain-containing protein n=1 Tax=Sunxiuqinia sp. A32 TaxID=3461496 RepID=UPI0040463CDB
MAKRVNFLFSIIIVVSGLLLGSCSQSSTVIKETSLTELRAPAYPLITIDPYTCAWSESDQLFDTPVRHWTGKTHSLIGAIRVDNEVYRFLGDMDIPCDAVIPMANYEAWEGKYTMNEPKKGWSEKKFNDASWTVGKAAFGTNGMPALSTAWNTKDIWVRREFTMPDNLRKEDIYLIYSHDDIFELYLNGKQLVKTAYEWHNNVVLKIDRDLLDMEGENVIAAHCHNRTGGGYVDFGLFQESEQKDIFAQTAVQNKVAMSATQTHYNFTCGPVDLNVEFVSPLLPGNLDLLSRPVNYINYEVVSTDGATHDVQVYFETTPEWAVNEVSQEVEVS